MEYQNTFLKNSDFRFLFSPHQTEAEHHLAPSHWGSAQGGHFRLSQGRAKD